MRIGPGSKYANREGVLVRWTTSAQKTGQIRFDDDEGASKKPIPVAYRFLMPIPRTVNTTASMATSIPSNSSFDHVQPPGGLVPGRFVFYTEADYRAAHISQTLDDPDNEGLSLAIDKVVDAFIKLGFGSGDATLAFFQLKLDTAQESYVAHAKRSSSGK